MAEAFDLIVRGGTAVLPAGVAAADLGVRSGRIAAVGDLGTDSAVSVIDARHLHVLPGVIDTQVHFREPGHEHKEDLASGTAAAALGGVTTVFEMPNTKPVTDMPALITDKVRRAAGRAWIDHAFYLGASAANADRLGEWEGTPGCCGVKVFMGSSTGSLLVEGDTVLKRIFTACHRRVAVHAEDEARLRERKTLIPARAGVEWHPRWRDPECAIIATQRLIGLAQAAGKTVHVLHVSTAEEMDLLRAHRDLATVEVSPQHLTLAAPECYARLGTLAQMNPPIRDERHRAALWAAVADGTVDCLGSDHAPHTRAEKAATYPASPSGMPGVQTLLGIMLDHVNAGRLSLARLVELTSAGPRRVFGIAGKGRLAVGDDADLVLVDLKARHTITDAEQASKSGWTPFAGLTVTGWPVTTILRGTVVMRDGALVGKPGGRPIGFAL